MIPPSLFTRRSGNLSRLKCLVSVVLSVGATESCFTQGQLYRFVVLHPPVREGRKIGAHRAVPSVENWSLSGCKDRGGVSVPAKL